MQGAGALEKNTEKQQKDYSSLPSNLWSTLKDVPNADRNAWIPSIHL